MHAAEPLEILNEAPAGEPLPVEQTISQEEEIPDTYREPLILLMVMVTVLYVAAVLVWSFRHGRELKKIQREEGSKGKVNAEPNSGPLRLVLRTQGPSEAGSAENNSLGARRGLFCGHVCW